VEVVLPRIDVVCPHCHEPFVLHLDAQPLMELKCPHCRKTFNIHVKETKFLWQGKEFSYVLEYAYA
jgi:phage FluMu protein Com